MLVCSVAEHQESDFAQAISFAAANCTDQQRTVTTSQLDYSVIELSSGMARNCHVRTKSDCISRSVSYKPLCWLAVVTAAQIPIVTSQFLPYFSQSEKKAILDFISLQIGSVILTIYIFGKFSTLLQGIFFVVGYGLTIVSVQLIESDSIFKH